MFKHNNTKNMFLMPFINKFGTYHLPSNMDYGYWVYLPTIIITHCLLYKYNIEIVTVIYEF